MTITDTAVIPAQRTSADNGSTNESWALVQRCQAGDMAAFGLIYERYRDMVSRYVRSRVYNGAIGEDLAADTFVRAMKSIGNYTWQGRDLGAWLLTIARNLIADYYKSGRYRLEVTTGEILGDDTRDWVDHDEPAVTAEFSRLTAAVQAAVMRLSPDQAEVLELRFFRGLSVAATAQAMGRTDGAIKQLTIRAIGSIRRDNPELEAWR